MLEIQIVLGGVVENDFLEVKGNEIGSDFSLVMWKEKVKKW